MYKNALEIQLKIELKIHTVPEHRIRPVDMQTWLKNISKIHHDDDDDGDGMMRVRMWMEMQIIMK